MEYSSNHIRNFVIIAHVDHGKSTLADRFLELTGTVEKRKMREQFLDQMDLEREKGITIKMQPVRMVYKLTTNDQQLTTNRKSSVVSRELSNSGQEFVLNLIDTPGHVDFAYEVSRALAAVEGAVLLVDGTQGVQAQTVANMMLAKKENLFIIPAINKIDLASCQIEETRKELKQLLSCSDNDINLISGKTGEGVRELLENIIAKIPPPRGEREAPLRALIFDSQFDNYKGVIAHVRIVDGQMLSRQKVKLAQTGAGFEVLEVGVFHPALGPTAQLSAGEIGYAASGLKEPQKIRAGDTITKLNIKNQISKIAEELTVTEALPGYQEPKPMVFASVYPENADDYELFRDALQKLKLNDASLFFEPESSLALGRGFRMGFLGLLHLEIAGQRLEREYGLRLIFSTPSVSYRIKMRDGKAETLYSAAKFPESRDIVEITEPWAGLTIITSDKYIGTTMQLLQGVRGKYIKQEHLGVGRVEIKYEAPLAEIIVDFYDRLKAATEGYGSMSYELIDFRPGNLVKLDILIAGALHEAFSAIVPKDNAYAEGRRLTKKLKELLPRALFPVAIQASIGGDVIARETLTALKKDVTGYLYGGDRTRKMKLWKKQQKGKKRLKEMGRVEIPTEVFLKMLKK